MKSGSVDLVVTDPPYLMQNIHEYKGNELGKHIIKYQQPLQEKNLTEGYDIRILDEIFRVMKAPNIYIWCNIAQVPMYIKYFVLEKKCRMDILIWNKTNPCRYAIINGFRIRNTACISERAHTVSHRDMQRQRQSGIFPLM